MTREAHKTGNLSLDDFRDGDAQGTLDGQRLGAAPEPSSDPAAADQDSDPEGSTDERTRERPQCAAENASTGGRCSNRALPDGHLCGLHDGLDDVTLVPLGPEAPDA
jgi:hypothetical protein